MFQIPVLQLWFSFFHSPNKTSSQVHQSEEDEECVPADCSNSSSTSAATTIADVPTTPQTLFLSTTSAGPKDCLSILTVALSERYVKVPQPFTSVAGVLRFRGVLKRASHMVGFRHKATCSLGFRTNCSFLAPSNGSLRNRIGKVRVGRVSWEFR